MFNHLYYCNTVYSVKLVKFIFILDSFAFVSQSFVIRTKTPVKEYFCTIWEVKQSAVEVLSILISEGSFSCCQTSLLLDCFSPCDKPQCNANRFQREFPEIREALYLQLHYLLLSWVLLLPLGIHDESTGVSLSFNQLVY